MTEFTTTIKSLTNFHLDKIKRQYCRYSIFKKNALRNLHINQGFPECVGGGMGEDPPQKNAAVPPPYFFGPPKKIGFFNGGGSPTSIVAVENFFPNFNLDAQIFNYGTYQYYSHKY